MKKIILVLSLLLLAKLGFAEEDGFFKKGRKYTITYQISLEENVKTLEDLTFSKIVLGPPYASVADEKKRDFYAEFREETKSLRKMTYYIPLKNIMEIMTEE